MPYGGRSSGDRDRNRGSGDRGQTRGFDESEYSLRNVNLEGVIVAHYPYYLSVMVDKFHSKDGTVAGNSRHEMVILKVRITDEIKVI